MMIIDVGSSQYIAITECTDTTHTCTCTSQFGGILNLHSRISLKLIAIQPASWIIITRNLMLVGLFGTCHVGFKIASTCTHPACLSCSLHTI